MMGCGWGKLKKRSSEGWQCWCGSSWEWRKQSECVPSPHPACLPLGGISELLPWARALGVPSRPWQGQPSLTVRLFGILVGALFCWLWLGCGSGCFFFFMALHEKYSIKFCILLQAPAEPNQKSGRMCVVLSQSVTAHWMLS